MSQLSHRRLGKSSVLPQANLVSRIILGGLTALVLLTANQGRAASGTWIVDADGLWSDSANWAGAVVADGADTLANFGTIDITGSAGATASAVTVTLNAPQTSGTVIFGDTVTSSSAGWIVKNNGTAANTLILATTGTVAPVITVNALAAGQVANISASLSGTGGFTKNGNGTLVLSGSHGISGPVTISGNTSVVRLENSGFLSVSNLTFVTPGSNGTNSFILNSGTLNVSGTTTIASTNATRQSSVIINAGVASLGIVSLDTVNTGSLLKITGGNVTMDNYLGGRATGGIANDFTLGFVMTGGTAVVSGTTIVWNQSLGSAMSIEGGSFTGQGPFNVTGFSSPTSTGTGFFRVTGGRFLVSDTAAGFVVLNKGSATAFVTFSGGTSTIEKLNMSSAAGTSNVTLSGSGALYLGSGGWIASNASSTRTITLASGTLGAKANWSSSLAMTTGTDVANSVTIKAANEANSPFDIALSGTLSGLGSIVKSGGGRLTLGGTSNYTGSTTVGAGALVVTGSLTATSGTMTVSSGATLGGSGGISSRLFVSGTVAPGIVTGTATTLFIGNNVTFNSGSAFVVNLDNDGNNSGKLAIAGTLSLVGTDTLTLNILNSAPTSNTFTIATFNALGLTGTFATVNNLPSGYTVVYDNPNGLIQVAPVPEPATWATLVSGIGLLMAYRRRKSVKRQSARFPG